MKDYTRAEAIAVAETPSLREIVADLWTYRIRATNLEAVLLAIREDHKENGGGSTWRCVDWSVNKEYDDDNGEDRRCALCQRIDAALQAQTVLQ